VRRWMRRFGVIVPLLVWTATSAQGGGATPGPTDGAGWPPTDLDRVAVGRPAPDFALESKDGARVTLSSFLDRKNIVLVFYRGHW
jgi:cytochrome oxidase Cu insertion factor (SCO1/SenC/PrrC family)